MADLPCTTCALGSQPRAMRKTGVYSVECECGVTVEWPDTEREAQCRCGRVLAAPEAWSVERPRIVQPFEIAPRSESGS